MRLWDCLRGPGALVPSWEALGKQFKPDAPAPFRDNPEEEIHVFLDKLTAPVRRHPVLSSSAAYLLLGGIISKRLVEPDESLAIKVGTAVFWGTVVPFWTWDFVKSVYEFPFSEWNRYRFRREFGFDPRVQALRRKSAQYDIERCLRDYADKYVLLCDEHTARISNGEGRKLHKIAKEIRDTDAAFTRAVNLATKQGYEAYRSIKSYHGMIIPAY